MHFEKSVRIFILPYQFFIRPITFQKKNQAFAEIEVAVMRSQNRVWRVQGIQLLSQNCQS